MAEDFSAAPLELVRLTRTYQRSQRTSSVQFRNRPRMRLSTSTMSPWTICPRSSRTTRKTTVTRASLGEQLCGHCPEPYSARDSLSGRVEAPPQTSREHSIAALESHRITSHITDGYPVSALGWIGALHRDIPSELRRTVLGRRGHHVPDNMRCGVPAEGKPPLRRARWDRCSPLHSSCHRTCPATCHL